MGPPEFQLVPGCDWLETALSCSPFPAGPLMMKPMAGITHSMIDPFYSPHFVNDDSEVWKE